MYKFFSVSKLNVTKFLVGKNIFNVFDHLIGILFFFLIAIDQSLNAKLLKIRKTNALTFFVLKIKFWSEFPQLYFT